MELLTVQEVSKILKCNINMVYRLYHAGLLPLLKLGSLKCRPADLDDFLKKHVGKDITDPYNVRDLEVNKNEN